MTPLDAGVSAWLEKADSDLLCIENNIAADRVPWDAVVFHAQQAGEKVLKALLGAAVRYPDPVYSPTEEDGREMTAAALRLRSTVGEFLEKRASH